MLLGSSRPLALALSACLVARQPRTPAARMAMPRTTKEMVDSLRASAQAGLQAHANDFKDFGYF